MQLSVPRAAALGGRMGLGPTTKLGAHWERLGVAFAHGAAHLPAGWEEGASFPITRCLQSPPTRQRLCCPV